MKKRAAGFLIFRRCPGIEYLLLKASYGSLHWTPPKGHVDDGESDFATALRETAEESGYTQKDLNIYENLSKTLSYRVKGAPKDVIYWLAELKSPELEPKLSEEHTEYRWLSADEAIKLSGFKDFETMILYFHEKIPTL